MNQQLRCGPGTVNPNFKQSEAAEVNSILPEQPAKPRYAIFYYTQYTTNTTLQSAGHAMPIQSKPQPSSYFCQLAHLTETLICMNISGQECRDCQVGICKIKTARARARRSEMSVQARPEDWGRGLRAGRDLFREIVHDSALPWLVREVNMIKAKKEIEISEGKDNRH